MKRLSKLGSKAVIIVLLLSIIGCCPCRNLTSSESESDRRSDSTRIEYRERVTFVPDTILIELPPEKAERTTADSISHLENDYAVSDARILTDGSLFHTLATKPQAKPVPTTQKVIRQDSIVYRDRWHTNTKTKTVKAKKRLSWLEKAQIWGCRGLLLLVVITYTIKTIRTHIRQVSNK